MSNTLAAFVGGAGIGWLLNEALTRYQARLQRRLDELNERTERNPRRARWWFQ